MPPVHHSIRHPPTSICSYCLGRAHAMHADFFSADPAHYDTTHRTRHTTHRIPHTNNTPQNYISRPRHISHTAYHIPGTTYHIQHTKCHEPQTTHHLSHTVVVPHTYHIPHFTCSIPQTRIPDITYHTTTHNNAPQTTHPQTTK